MIGSKELGRGVSGLVGAISRRWRDNAHRDDVLECFIDVHVEFDDLLFFMIRKKPEVGFGVVGT